MTVVQCELILNRQHYVSIVVLDDICVSCGLATTKVFHIYVSAVFTGKSTIIIVNS